MNGLNPRNIQNTDGFYSSQHFLDIVHGFREVCRLQTVDYGWSVHCGLFLPLTGNWNGSLVRSGQSTTLTLTSAKLSSSPVCKTATSQFVYINRPSWVCCCTTITLPLGLFIIAAVLTTTQLLQIRGVQLNPLSFADICHSSWLDWTSRLLAVQGKRMVEAGTATVWLKYNQRVNTSEIIHIPGSVSSSMHFC